MRWVEQYRSKVKSAEEAVRAVRSGDRVHIHNGCSKPSTLVDALVARAPELRDVELVHMACMGSADYVKPEYEGIFRHVALFIGSNVRKAVQEGRADYIPIFLSEIESLFRSGAMPLDVTLLQCSPPDDYGFMSLCAGTDIALTTAQTARHVIIEVNDQAPRIHGDAFLHVSKADTIVETSHPLCEYRSFDVTDVHRVIAKHVANLIPDGATIQTGIGGIPEAVLIALKDHKEIGVHSEMCPDRVVDLIQSGVITNDRKSLHPHKVVTAFLLGTRKIFDFVHDNPAFEFHPTAYVNDPFVIAQNERMVAINSAIEVDLTGQVCADSVSNLPFSGFGGQVDFIRGASRSKGGVPIIALPATAKEGAFSRIVPSLKTAAGVVTSRADVRYVVTEFGVAYLHGKTLRQRAEALIQIAEPKFRDELTEAAARMGYLDTKPSPAIA
ncbi:MAG TPA: acetyl-CoA hydrolase/transferase C-terminal domain-containing protein [Bryobacteraceae bacterium]|nr:acetyl-CoA hydrolase/transferase C-terminal domain-containing protein [Bryobacteraceae bacterium]